MIAEIIARALGGARRGAGGWWSCRCPMHEDRHPSLSLRDGAHGLVTHCHAGCDRRDVVAELRRRGLIEDRGRSSAPTPPVCLTARSQKRGDHARRIAFARYIWDNAQNAHGTPVEAYIARRGISTSALPAKLRWASKCWSGEECAKLPAMIALVEHVAHGIVGVHRTYLFRDEAGQWGRRARASFGPIGGGAVRLSPAAETVLIAEGIETGFSAMLALGLPAWASLSAPGMTSLVLPQIVRSVIICADHDRSGVGERAARSAAERWVGEGRRVRIALPPEAGTDFNDVLRGLARTSRGFSNVDA